MRLLTVLQLPKVATIAMLALISSGCNNSDASGGMSTDANSTEDAALDDVLGANNVAANNLAAPAHTPDSGL
jgi:hypothetical protein